MQQPVSRRLLFAAIAVLPLLASRPILAGSMQGQPEQIRLSESVTGTVIDPSGAVVPGALVTLVGPGGTVGTTKTGATGKYILRADPGTYTLTVEAKGFARFESKQIEFGVAAAHTLDVRLKIATLLERVEVPEEAALDSDRSGMRIVLGEREIEQMPRDSQALLEELQGLAGSASTQIIVDGFTGSKLPPRDTIREIKINQNPYSAQNDTDTVSGVIQVLSKPGTNQLHGEADVYGTDSALNASNPFMPDQPSYYESGITGALSGSTSRNTSFYAYLDSDRQETNTAVNAQTLDSGLNQTASRYALPSPKSLLHALGREDLQAGNRTLTLRYAFDRTMQTNGGVGQLSLATQALDTLALVHTLQATYTQVFSTSLVNEARMQYIRTRTQQTPVSADPTILVQGAFIGGGNDQGFVDDNLDRYEFSNNLGLSRRAHYFEFGGRIRVGRDSIASRTNFNGQFIFASLSAYQATLRGMAAGQNIAQIIAAGGGANQYSITVGNPQASSLVADGAVYAQDSWRARNNVTISYGLRLETQGYISDHADFAPRLGFSWALGSGKKAAAGSRYVIHGGAGVFYQRFTVDSALNVERQNGVLQQEYVMERPQFCPPAPVSSGSCPVARSMAAVGMQSGSTVYRVSPSFQAPYFAEESIGITRQLGAIGSAALTYLNSRGVHTQYTENANAPSPGTYIWTTPGGGVRPDGTNRNVYQYTSEGIYRSNLITANVSLRKSRLQAYATYILRFSKSNAEPDGTFPTDIYNLAYDYAPADADVRHSLTVSTEFALPYGIRSQAYLRVASGAPFNVVLGQDLNGDTQYNDRPAFAADPTGPTVVKTRWGLFDSNPIPGETVIPRNYAGGPGQLSLDMELIKSIGIGPEIAPAVPSGSSHRKYTLELLAQLTNVLNHQNLAAPVPVLSSPLFGRSVGLAGGSSLSPDRAVLLQLSMRF